MSDLKRYIVALREPSHRENLLHLGKVGNPQAITTMVIVDTSASVSDIEAIEGVVSVSEDGLSAPEATVDQPNAPQWALPWMSRTNGSFQSPKSGENVDIYVLDTGVRDTHTDLVGRVTTLWSFDDVPYSTSGYVPEHGTAVAACAAGTTYGVAKDAHIISLRIDWYNSTILKCLDMIIKHHVDKDPTRQSVINFSGSSPMPVVGEMFRNAAMYGIVVVAAAGNYSESTPRYPANAWYVTGVGSLDSNEQPSAFSNRGVPVWAPGGNITTAGVMSDSQSINISGTSFACPYYAGVLACNLEGSDRFNTGAQASNFEFYVRMQLNDLERIPFFPNGMSQRSTPNMTKTLTGVYYSNPSFQLTDQEIADFVWAHEPQAQVIADAAREFNIDLNRLSTALGLSRELINEYFIWHEVKPWWAVGPEWNFPASASVTYELGRSNPVGQPQSNDSDLKSLSYFAIIVTGAAIILGITMAVFGG